MRYALILFGVICLFYGTMGLGILLTEFISPARKPIPNFADRITQRKEAIIVLMLPAGVAILVKEGKISNGKSTKR